MSKNPFRRPKDAVKGAAIAPHIPVPKGQALVRGAERATGDPLPGEQLTKVVQGQPATDLEERVSRAAAKHPKVQAYWFNPRLVYGRILPPNLSLSYAIYAPVLLPLQVDPVYPGNTGDERAAAAVNDALLTEYLKGIGAGALPVVRFSRLELGTQQSAEQALGRVV